MIKINYNELDNLANTYYLAIENYINKCHPNPSDSKSLNSINKIFKSHLKSPLNTFKSIVLAKPNKLKIIARQAINTNILSSNFNYFITLYNYLNSDKYKYKYHGKDESINAKIILNELNITVCPYCNRNFIYNAGNKRTSELDHYYPKSKYPYFALSFYNLVPSCKICNQLKNNSTLEHINPYDDTFPYHDIKFRFNPKSTNYKYDKEQIDLELEISNLNVKNKRLFKNHKTVFHIEALYEGHKDYVVELIQKNEIYSPSYLEDLFNNYREILMINDKNDLLRLITGNYVSNDKIHLRPLAKLNKDILEQLNYFNRQ